MSRFSDGSISVATATLPADRSASERGRIATPMPRATSRLIRSLSFDSSLICGSNPALWAANVNSSRKRAPSR